VTKYFAIIDDSGAKRNVIVAGGGADMRRLDRKNEWVQDPTLLTLFMGTAGETLKVLTKSEARQLAKQLGATGLP